MNSVSAASCGFDEEGLSQVALAALHKYPAVDALLAHIVLVFLLVVWLVVIDSFSYLFSFLMLIGHCLFKIFIVVGHKRRFFLNFEIIDLLNGVFLLFAHLFVVLIDFRVLVFSIVHLQREGTVHQCFVFGCNLFWRGSVNTVCIVTGTDKKGNQGD